MPGEEEHEKGEERREDRREQRMNKTEAETGKKGKKKVWLWTGSLDRLVGFRRRDAWEENEENEEKKKQRETLLAMVS